jgi:hypothetical protein
MTFEITEFFTLSIVLCSLVFIRIPDDGQSPKILEDKMLIIKTTCISRTILLLQFLPVVSRQFISIGLGSVPISSSNFISNLKWMLLENT